MRPHLTLLATVAAGAIALTGCGGEASDNAGQQDGSAGSSASSSAGPAPSQSQQGGQGGSQVNEEGVRWMDGFCGSLAEFSASSQGTPKPETQDPAALKKSMNTMLGKITQSTDKFLSDMNAMDSSPTDGGDKFLSTAKDSYRNLRETANEAKSELDKAPASDKQATSQAVQAASSKLQQVDLQKPIKQLQGNQQLSGEFQQAPKCRELLQAAQQQGGGQQQPPQQQPQQPGN
ncbi:hypothetical protein FB384_002712 [Prauserella sediminis]|uniref:Small secreted protein n=1 Tax=Prauserella sediminis TaxID=577680 RepID=A0A839XS79_9PSEU|nr:hypothetical protein [Prauserella sediminis]MBB3663808.1 hypothetical protein [Prauserella sediminis]